MLYKFHTNILIVTLLAYGLISVLIYQRVFCVMTIGFLVAFVTQMALLIFFAQEKERELSPKLLFWTVLVYTLFLGSFLMLISYYYDGDTFMFCKFDAMFYYSYSMKFAELGLVQGLNFVVHTFEYDDWGAIVFDGLMMSIVPDKLFLNAVHLILGATTSVYLYKIGRYYMPDIYAFLAALGFGTSSYIVFFHCSFLKESVFVFMVVATLYYLFLFITNQSRSAWLPILLLLIAQLFYRPAVTAMLLVSAMVYYAITQRKNAISIFLYAAAAVVFAASLGDLQQIMDSNTQGGNVEALVAETNNSSYSYSFNYFVSLFGAIFGPFPSSFPKNPEAPTWVVFYGAGLSYRMFLVFAFWTGIYMIFKKKLIELYPIVMFVLFELVATGLVCASLELRKVILHIPFIYLIAFYGLWTQSEKDNSMSYTVWIKYGFIIAVFYLWNVVKV